MAAAAKTQCQPATGSSKPASSREAVVPKPKLAV
jgi:hypothetical protein